MSDIIGTTGSDNLKGTQGDDVIYGGAGDDHVNAKAGDDIIDGGAGNDHIIAGSGDDRLRGGSGNDFLHGGLGHDVAIFSGSIKSYTFRRNGEEFFVTGPDGADKLLHIEQLQFDDALITLGVNNAPIAFDDVAATGEDAGTLVGATSVLANDFDFEGDVLRAVAGTFVGTYGTLVLNQNGTYTYTLNAGAQALALGQVVQDVFAYSVSDGSLTDTGTLTISVTGANDAPVANADAATTSENVAVLVNVLANDTDIDNGAVLTVTAASAPAGQGISTVVGNQVRFDPGADFDTLAVGQTAAVLVTYTITDQHGATATSTISVTVTGTNDGPVANSDTATTSENAAVLVDVLANDTDVDNGAVLTVTAASAPVGQGSASVVGNQVRFDPGSDFDSLGVGQSAVVTVSYTITDDQGATSSSTIAVTVTGTNDGPVANADAATTSENAVVLVNVLANDTDADANATLTIIAASAPAGQGVASVVGNQVRFDPGSDFDSLAVGQSAIVTVGYTISDDQGATSSSTISITVTGTNDGPVANPDTGTTSENAVVLVDVRANDTDVDNGAVLTVTAASAPVGQGSATVVGNQVRFDPGADFDYLAVGESALVTVNYTISDDQGATASSTIAVTVTGTNDAPTIDAANTNAAGAVTELPNNDPNENNFTHQASGAVAFDDLDLSDTHSATATAQGGGYLGTFALAAVDQGGDSVGWTFNVEDSAIDFLGEGEVLTQVYTVTIADGNGGTATQDVTVTITGRADNVAPIAVDDAYSVRGNVTLNVPAANGVLANDSDDAGVGAGPGQTSVSAFSATSANGGTVSVNPDGSFSYTSAAGFNGTDTFTYTITDAGGLSDTATVTVSVGASLWFIDNAAVGSTNVGTQANPFTSIAAFNAAQGTANGPAAGETVYLRAGTGTYAEADGINLLAGQTLIGGGENLVVGGDLIETGTGRPSIVTTGPATTSHGVEVSANNVVRGLDIGSTTGAGIADSNGSVGTLTVSNVAKSGSGQIIDVDQGGTLAVTLNSAASTSSTGGAIDLNLVSGSFTVAGATTIAGAAGGGLDATNGTNLAIAFGGGLTVTTTTATAVNFATNGGASTLDIVGLTVTTTTGAGLRAATGGTVTVTGATNTISTTGGTAVNIFNTAIGTGGVTLQSVSSTGGTPSGIVLNNAGTGGFTVTGIGSIAGSGGTIANKIGTDPNSPNQGVGVAITGTSNVSLANMAITGNSNGGVVGANVTNFSLTDSTLTNNGSSGTEGAIVMNGLTGTANLLGNVIAGSSGDNVRIVQSSGTLALTIADSANDQAVVGTNSNATGNDGVNVTTSGAASLTLVIDGVAFQGAKADVLEVVALGNSMQNVTITGNGFNNVQTGTIAGAGGVVLSGGGAGSNIAVDYEVAGNTFTGAVGTALSAKYTQQAGTVRGAIVDNVIGVGDGVATGQGSSGGGEGLAVSLEKSAGAGMATHIVSIVGNEIYDVALGLAAISLTSSGGGAANPAVLEATIQNNVVEELGEFAFTALYAVVGGTAGSGDFARMGLDLDNNVLDASGAAFGGNAVYLDQVSTDAFYYFPGYAGSADGEGLGGTASADLSAFLTGQGNVLTNGGGASYVGGVDATFVNGVTGQGFDYPVFMP